MKAPHHGIGTDTLAAGPLPTTFVKPEELAHAWLDRAGLSSGHGYITDAGCTTVSSQDIAQSFTRYDFTQSFDGARQAQNRTGFAIAPVLRKRGRTSCGKQGGTKGKIRQMALVPRGHSLQTVQ